MSKPGRTLGLKALLIVAVVGCSSSVCFSVARHRAASRGKELLQDVRDLRVGTATAKDVAAIVARYHGSGPFEQPESLSGPGGSVYNIVLFSPTMGPIGRHLPLNRVGIHFWGLVVQLQVTNGTLTRTELVVGSETSSGKALEAKMEEREYQKSPYDHGIPYEVAPFLVSGSNPETLAAHINTKATKDERAKAFDLSWECAESIHGCKNVCQLMPSAAKDYLANEASIRASIGIPEPEYPHCH